MWGILDDLVLLIDCGYDNVFIQTDNLEAVKAIKEMPSNGSNSALIRRIHQLLTRIGHRHIRHFSREDNQDADRLVKLAQHRTYDLCLYEVSPLRRTEIVGKEGGKHLMMNDDAVALVLVLGMVNGGMQAKYHSLHQQMKGVNEKIQMTSSRKLLMGAMLDYEETGANTKHEPRKRPGKP
ncbi:hypothetical protein Gohar_018954 [Gossypium harknessii]|uniref:RNase H type-1 domain-containing protein n=1 Tax=Gossypium harknessii TaxID=34285 RepID=A0A7J9GCT2_9ROSI|nr:hypothetical protein [Gossypium harknessii]